MKITIEAEDGDKYKTVVLTGVSEFAICGMQVVHIIPPSPPKPARYIREPFRRSVVGDSALVCGLLVAVGKDIEHYEDEMVAMRRARVTIPPGVVGEDVDSVVNDAHAADSGDDGSDSS